MGAGYDPDAAQVLTPQRKKAALTKLFKDMFGIPVNFGQGKKRIQALDAIDQLLDGYRGIRFIAHVLERPTNGIGLGGRLSLVLEKHHNDPDMADDPERAQPVDIRSGGLIQEMTQDIR